ncbi:MAG: hypothetical protein AAFR81_05975 [Chloroflexota bacterium]
MTMTDNSNKNDSIEVRLEPWIDRAEYIIGLTIIIMAWSAGWVDLFAFESFSTQVFGRYSYSLFAFLVVFTLMFGFWLWLIISIKALDGLRSFLAFMQRSPLLVLVVYIGVFGILYSMTIVKYWSNFTLMQGMILTIMLVFTVFLLFTNMGEAQIWRKVIWGILGVFLLIEGGMHALASLGTLPVENTTGMYQSYGRVYTTGEQSVYATTNRYGWYYPEFVIDDENYNIVLNGDTFIRGLEVGYDDLLGTQLQAQFEGDETQIMPMGQPGFGANTYLSTEFYGFIWETMQADEMVIFVHLANDFQVEEGSLGERPSYDIRDDGITILHPDDDIFQHVIHHVIFEGHQPLILIEVIMSHSFVVTMIEDAIASTRPDLAPYELHAPVNDWERERVPQYTVAMPIESRTEDMPFGTGTFLFEVDGSERADESYKILFDQIAILRARLEEQGISIRVVTIPFFPEAFYETQSGTNWGTELDATYDILLPEVRLTEYANDAGIPILAMGEYMFETGMDVSDIQALFFENGSGAFTPAGHAYFAEAVFGCFYAEITSEATACYSDD